MQPIKERWFLEDYQNTLPLIELSLSLLRVD